MVNIEHDKENHLVKVAETLPVIKDINSVVRKQNKLDGELINVNPQNYDNLAINMNNRARAVLAATGSRPIEKTGRNKLFSSKVEVLNGDVKETWYITKDCRLELKEIALFDMLISILQQQNKYNENLVDKVKDNGVILLDKEFIEYLGFEYGDKSLDNFFESLFYLSKVDLYFTYEPLNKVSDIRKVAHDSIINVVPLIRFDYGYIKNKQGQDQFAFEVKIPCYKFIREVKREDGTKSIQYNTSIPRAIAKTVFKKPMLYHIVKYIAFNFCQLKCNTTIRITTLMEYLGDDLATLKRELSSKVKISHYFERLTKYIIEAFQYFPNLELELNVEMIGIRNLENARIVWKNKKKQLPKDTEK